MHSLDRKGQLQAMASNLDALIAFADQEEDFVLAATLELARSHLTDHYPEAAI